MTQLPSQIDPEGGCEPDPANGDGPLRLSRLGLRTVGTPVSFTFDGVTVDALAGDTIASALMASGHRAMRQSDVAASDGKPDWRGLYCGMGACFDCAVTVDGRAGQRACMTKVSGGEQVRSSMPSGSGFDLLSPLAGPPEGVALKRITTDILVIGAGPGGLSAALAARSCGAEVLLLDERSQAGGQFYKPVSEAFSSDQPMDRQFASGDALYSSVLAAGIKVEQGATVYGAFSPDEIVAEINGEAVLVNPNRLILATGAYERAMPIPGWTLPGVMTTGAAQTLARAYQVPPGKRIVIAGNGPLNFQLAADLADQGVTVLAVVESAAKPGAWQSGSLIRAFAADAASMNQGRNYLHRLKEHKVPVLWSHMAVGANGNSQLENVSVASIGSDGAIMADSVQIFEADCLCLGYGFVSSSEIASALGCRMLRDDRHLGSLCLDRTEDCETSISGVFAVGDGAYVQGSKVAEAEGAIAGACAARQMGFSDGAAAITAKARRKRSRARSFQDALWTLFKSPSVGHEWVPDETILCRCEGLAFGRIRGLITEGAASLAVLKRQCRLGMGRCQGRYCTAVAANLLAKEQNAKARVAPSFAPRFPAKPFPAAIMGLEKPEWGGHERAGSPDLAPVRDLAPFGKLTADTVVIGAGVVGACLAHDLAKAGQDVLVAERDDANLQASGSNAGSLHVQLLSFDFGEKAEAGGGPAAATLPLGPYAVSLWRDLAEASDADFEVRVTGGLMVAESASGMEFLKSKVALERSRGIEAEIIGPNELRQLAPGLSENLVGAEYAPGEGKINPLTATYSLLSQAQRMGARFFPGTDVLGLEGNGRGWTVKTNRGTINAGRIINAAGPWAREIGGLAGLEVPVYSAPLQMIVTERAPTLVDQLVAHADRHLSLKQLSTGGIVIGGAWTAKYSASQNMNVTTRESIEGNLWVANRVLPQLSGVRVVRTWAGMNVNIDGAPILGEAPGAPGFYNAVSSNGYTLAPALSQITLNLIAGRDPGFDVAPYLLDRF